MNAEQKKYNESTKHDPAFIFEGFMGLDKLERCYSPAEMILQDHLQRKGPFSSIL